MGNEYYKGVQIELKRGAGKWLGYYHKDGRRFFVGSYLTEAGAYAAVCTSIDLYFEKEIDGAGRS